MGKSVGRHPEKALTAVQIRNAKGPGRYADGNGLYLLVDPSGAKRWLLRIVVQGKRRDIGLGSITLVSLAEAREKALEFRKLARSGGDPLAARRRAQVVVPTFAEAAEVVFNEHLPSWKNAKHGQQWINTLRTYAFGVIGHLPVDQIGNPDILRVLAPIWLIKRETASRVRQRVRTIFDWAKAAGHRTGENPVDGVEMGLPKQGDRKGHHAAMPFMEVPGFVARLRSSVVGEMGRLALEFLILTATRSGEVRGARWAEIDLCERLWTVPAIRMKAGRAHRIPLSPRCIEIIERVRMLGVGSEFIFPNQSSLKPMSDMIFNMTMRRMEVHVTAHGFRSSFRDWAAEVTNYSNEVAEMALADTAALTG